MKLELKAFTYVNPNQPARKPAENVNGIKVLLNRGKIKEQREMREELAYLQEAALELSLAEQHKARAMHRDIHIKAAQLIDKGFRKKIRREYRTAVEEKQWIEKRNKFIRTNAHTIVSVATSAHWFQHLSDDLACVPAAVHKGELTPCQIAGNNAKECKSALFDLANTLGVRIDKIGSIARDHQGHAYHVISPGVYDSVTGEKLVPPELERKTVANFEVRRPDMPVLLRGLDCAKELSALLK